MICVTWLPKRPTWKFHPKIAPQSPNIGTIPRKRVRLQEGKKINPINQNQMFKQEIILKIKKQINNDAQLKFLPWHTPKGYKNHHFELNNPIQYINAANHVFYFYFILWQSEWHTFEWWENIFVRKESEGKNLKVLFCCPRKNGSGRPLVLIISNNPFIVSVSHSYYLVKYIFFGSTMRVSVSHAFCCWECTSVEWRRFRMDLLHASCSAWGGGFVW